MSSPPHRFLICHGRVSNGYDSSVSGANCDAHMPSSPDYHPHPPLHYNGSICINTLANPCASVGQPSLEEGQGESSCDCFVSRSQSRALHQEGGISEDMDRDVGRAGRASVQTHAASLLYADVAQEQEYFQQVLGSSSQGWTDKKHSSYLDSMEAQFLKCVLFNKQNSVSHFDTSSELTDSASSVDAKSSNEFKVCQNGQWKSMKFGPLAHLAVAVRNPWIKRFRSTPKQKLPSLVLEDLQGSMARKGDGGEEKDLSAV